MNYDSYKEQVICTCNDIIDNCDRMTSGNYMHNINAIKLMAKIIRDNCLPHLFETLQSPWISVEDKLPEEHTDVIVTDGSSVAHCKKYGDGFYTNIGKCCNVTHWMPIPELPKEERL